ncbi:MAG TPA: HD domain-containing phosphohydrolase [Thermoleophilaceae bacterium]|jgi:putative nucleotidyltransferase with HDIG domain|nr:HD domain-containing phosphohydrolase [Thermoleophilaceae bacterium]
MAALLAAATGLGIAVAGAASWNLPLLVSLFGFAVASDLWAIDTRASLGDKGRLLMSGSFVALVVATVLLGGAPAALIGAGTIVVGHLRFNERHDLFANNLVAYTWFPLLGGTAFDAAHEALGATADDPGYYALVGGVFFFALGVNFLLIAGYGCYLDRTSLREKAKRALAPALGWDLVAAALAVSMAYAYHQLGGGALVLFAVVMLSSQRLLGQVFAAERRAEQLEERMEAFAKLHVGLLHTMIRTLDLRDRMTARHSAAVAHYAREIAAAIGMSEDEQEIVHTAGLLHDIGKFNLPDRILKADVPLGEAEWALIRTHPEEGARLVAHLEGYAAAADLVRAHHERFDGKGYPNRLAGTGIPLGARIISVADTYDVLTARDSYRRPVSPARAIDELRRVAGSQLDPAVVSVFADLLATNDLRYRHGNDADFETELAMDTRITRYAAGVAAGARVST